MRHFIIITLASFAAAARLDKEIYLPPTAGSSSGANAGLQTPYDPAKEGRLRANVEFVRYENEINQEGYRYAFETSDGTQVEQEGHVVPGPVPEEGTLKVQGSYSYVGDDGQTYAIRYTADETGYHPEGSHLPTPPPIPEEILRSLQLTAPTKGDAACRTMFVMKCVVIVFVISFDIGFCTIAYHKKQFDNNLTTFKYYTKTSNVITIPMMVHLDRPLLSKLPKHRTENKFMKREKFKKMTKNILKNVEKIFRQPSLNQSIHLVLLDVKVLRSKFSKVAMDENVSVYLKSYCDWQGEKKVLKRKWFYSILLTGLDLYYLDGTNKKIRSSTGRGYMKGMCSVKNSCTMLKWHPKNLPYILAHELAHSLGIPHDGPPNNECQDQNYIMNAKYKPSNPAKNWSACTRRALHQFLKSNKAWCLHSEKRNMILI
ncbi:hypothetical protein K1T71_010463 [Dendrolimus kikuchii]|uniref:Uncharacterized protein n=1 Tax=Dendrolimus kikuchii TaxID=765133 RepID=A0ACC1CRU4_9NEOP|nr:hypothetical protein K1T71_010463 [Dendrolimus kikuchii]